MKQFPTKLSFTGVVESAKVTKYLNVIQSMQPHITISKPQEADVIIFFEHRFVDLLFRVLLRLRNRRGLQVLVVQEPRVVLPTNYRWWVRGFDKLHYLGFIETPIWRRSHHGRWPNQGMSSYAKIPSEGHGTVIINSNKVSAVPGGLYELRLQCYEEISDLHLAGWGWETSRLTKLSVGIKALVMAALSLEKPQLGSVFRWVLRAPFQESKVEDKFSFLRRFRFALVIENSMAYTSEKVFDALLAGVVPIYVGPPLSPAIENLVVRAEPCVEGIKNALEAAEKLNTKTWNQARLEFLNSQEAKLWDEKVVIQGIWRTIQESKTK